MSRIASVRHILLGTLLSIMTPAAPAPAGDKPLKLPPEISTLKPGPGLELVKANCLLCHSADYISTQPRLTPAQWRASVLKMQAKYGAPIATNNVDALVEYLAKNYRTR